jgi:tRNA threonylcarbamoyl adenosine modification protein YeaZ
VSDRTLVIDTATAACSVALFAADGELIGDAHDVVGRGHAEKLVPMIAGLPDGGRAGRILVDVGPGSFTGIRVGIAAARGLALGWGADVRGYSSLALVAIDRFLDSRPASPFAVVLEGGHGEVFVQRFAGQPDFAALDDVVSLTPDAAMTQLGTLDVVGNGVAALRDLPDDRQGPALLPRAARAPTLPPAYRDLQPVPFYGRAPDAKLPGQR